MIYLRCFSLCMCMTFTGIYGMESVIQRLNQLSLREKQRKTIMLRGARGQTVEIGYQAALLSPIIKHSIEVGTDSVNCPSIAREELDTIKNALEAMHNGIEDVSQITHDIAGGKQAVIRWAPLLQNQLYKSNELKDPQSEQLILDGRFTKRFEAANYFGLPLLQQILKQALWKEIRGNRLMTDLFRDVWRNHILPQVAGDLHLMNEDVKFSFDRLAVENSSPIRSVTCPVNDASIITGHQDGTIIITKTSTSESLKINGHNETVAALAVSSQGDWIVSGSRDVKVWDTATGQLMQTLSVTNLGSLIPGMVLSPDNKWLIIRLNNELFEIWDTITWKRVGGSRDVRECCVGSIAFSPDSSLCGIIEYQAGSWRGNSLVRVSIWNTGSWKRMKVLYDEKMDDPRLTHNSLIFSPDNEKLIIGGARAVWNIQSKTIESVSQMGTVCPTLCRLSDTTLVGAMSPDEEKSILFWPSEKLLMQLYDTTTWNRCTGLFTVCPVNNVHKIFFIPLDKTLIVVTGTCVGREIYAVDLKNFFSLDDYLGKQLSYSQYLFLKRIAAGEITSLTDYQSIVDTFDPSIKEALTKLFASKNTSKSRCSVM